MKGISLINGYGNLQRILKIQGENKEYKYSGFWKFGSFSVLVNSF